MIHLGKIFGFLLGYALSSSVEAAVIGALLGTGFDLYWAHVIRPNHARDIWWQEVSVHLILLHAKLAKLDGRVSAEEVRTFRKHIHVLAQDEESVAFLFNAARQTTDDILPLTQSLSHLLAQAQDGTALARSFAQSLCAIALCDDSTPDNDTLSLLDDILAVLGLAQDDRFILIKSAVRQGARTESDTEAQARRRQRQERAPSTPPAAERTDAYRTLGLLEGASLEDVKKRYRQLIRQHHPDRLQGKGADEDALRAAAERVTAVNVAYACLVTKQHKDNT